MKNRKIANQYFMQCKCKVRDGPDVADAAISEYKKKKRRDVY